jgi:MFS family permease
MKIDLVGPRQRGLAMGLNEFAGYVAVAASALATGWIAARYGIRPQPFYLGVVFVAVGLALSAVLVRETRHHVSHESALLGTASPDGFLTSREVFWRTTLIDRNLSSVSQAGLVNNLNDGMAWGLFPLVFAAAGMDLAHVGLLAAIYPATWGFGQLATGALSDRTGRKPLIVWGMWIQAAGIGVVTMAQVFAGFVTGAVLLGIGTAMVYPTLLAAIGDVAHPSWRASAVGVYRLWRDLGYAIGALLAGLTADAFGLTVAMWVIATLTFASGVVSAMASHRCRCAARNTPRRGNAEAGVTDAENTLRLPYWGRRELCQERSEGAAGILHAEVMLRNVGRHGGEVGVCATCMDARGIADAELTDTTHRSSLEELTKRVQWADHTLVF